MSSASEILERETELDRIAAALDARRHGPGRVVVIEGPAGIGKTRLVARDPRAGQAARLRPAAGDRRRARDARWPGASSARWWSARSSRYSGEVREAILAGPGRRAPSQALDAAPEERPATPSSPARCTRCGGSRPTSSADRPLLITVDDAQWADPPSLRFLGYLARRIADLPIALVVAHPAAGRRHRAARPS